MWKAHREVDRYDSPPCVRPQQITFQEEAQDNMKFLSTLVYIGFALVVVAAVLAWPIYRFHDCKKVGHSTFYCVMDIG